MRGGNVAGACVGSVKLELAARYPGCEVMLNNDRARNGGTKYDFYETPTVTLFMPAR